MSCTLTQHTSEINSSKVPNKGML